uniref:Ground-like domain-containing protein n=1 Tax=Meloidogyne incognita TaxID=6306 RepID=A0A914N0L7_MELIC
MEFLNRKIIQLHLGGQRLHHLHQPQILTSNQYSLNNLSNSTSNRFKNNLYQNPSQNLNSNHNNFSLNHNLNSNHNHSPNRNLSPSLNPSHNLSLNRSLSHNPSPSRNPSHNPSLNPNLSQKHSHSRHRPENHLQTSILLTINLLTKSHFHIRLKNSHSVKFIEYKEKFFSFLEPPFLAQEQQVPPPVQPPPAQQAPPPVQPPSAQQASIQSSSPPPQTSMPPATTTAQTSTRPKSTEFGNIRYPLPECYTNDDKMMCCNSKLEDTMRDAYKELLQEKGEDIFHRSNLQKITNRVQALTEAKFNTTFEVITAISDFASKSHFWSNHICKIHRDGRYILVYATPKHGRVHYKIGGGSQNEKEDVCLKKEKTSKEEGYNNLVEPSLPPYSTPSISPVSYEIHSVNEDIYGGGGKEILNNFSTTFGYTNFERTSTEGYSPSISPLNYKFSTKTIKTEEEKELITTTTSPSYKIKNQKIKEEFVVKPVKHSNTLTKSVSEEAESEESKEEEKEEGESKEGKSKGEKEESLEQSNNLSEESNIDEDHEAEIQGNKKNNGNNNSSSALNMTSVFRKRQH